MNGKVVRGSRTGLLKTIPEELSNCPDVNHVNISEKSSPKAQIRNIITTTTIIVFQGLDIFACFGSKFIS
jgi:hypothetical protein